MVLVDSSVWIAHLRGASTPRTESLLDAIADGQVLVGDLIMLEVLQGARTEAHASRLERTLREFPVASLLDEQRAVAASRNYRRLREQGITIRSTADLVIGTFCLEEGHVLLHDDRDFDQMERVLGLTVA